MKIESEIVAQILIQTINNKIIWTYLPIKNHYISSFKGYFLKIYNCKFGFEFLTIKHKKELFELSLNNDEHYINILREAVLNNKENTRKDNNANRILEDFKK